jgi:hypothetical protein
VFFNCVKLLSCRYVGSFRFNAFLLIMTIVLLCKVSVRFLKCKFFLSCLITHNFIFCVTLNLLPVVISVICLVAR